MTRHIAASHHPDGSDQLRRPQRGGTGPMPTPTADEIRSSELAGRVNALVTQLRTLLDSQPDDVTGKALFDELAELPLSLAQAHADGLLDEAQAVELLGTATDM